MAFKSMISGAECSTGNSPLSTLIKQQQTDHSLHQSTFSQAGPSSLRSQVPQANVEADRFFQSHTPMAPAGNFGMEAMRREIQNVPQDPQQSENWAAQYQPQSQVENHFQEQFQQGPNFTAEYLRQTPTVNSSQPNAPMYQSSFNSPMGMYGMARSGMSAMMMGNPMFSAPQNAESKGKNRVIDLNDTEWEAQFSKHDTVPETQVEEHVESQLEEEDNRASKAMQDQALAAWEAQFGSQFSDVTGDTGLDDLEVEGVSWTKNNVDSFLENKAPFPYSGENQYLSSVDPFAEGQRLLAEGAPLSEAALAFEAACKLDETRGEAWRAAGETWAADDREVKGIRALEKAVACGGSDGIAAWLSLAVAYVNEGEELRALATLEKWLALTYPDIQSKEVVSMGPWNQSSRITEMFLDAARAGPKARLPEQSNHLGVVDPDVQTGLGVLFYSNSEYDRARDCFEAALGVRPDDFLLWNRLGATLANGGYPEAAIDAYRKALEYRPSFTRATYNLGVSCLNIGCYQEAAEHLLSAIEGQNTQKSNEINGGDNDGANLWHTLRRAFLCMDRNDLADKCVPGTNPNDFRAEGFEF